MNIANVSTPNIFVISGNYSSLDSFSNDFIFTYTVENASSALNFRLNDGDSGNDSTSISHAPDGSSFTVTLSDLKKNYDEGLNDVVGSITVEIEDVSNSTTQSFNIDFKLVVDNQGTLLDYSPLFVQHINLNRSIGYSRDVAITELKSLGNLELSITGGSGDTDITWEADGFSPKAITVLDPSELSTNSVSVSLSSLVADIPQEYLADAGGNWVQSGEIEYTVRDKVTLESATGRIYWSFTVSVIGRTNPVDEFFNNDRVVSSRFRIRNTLGNDWHDICYSEMYAYDVANREWVRMIPGKTFIRDANNKDWLEVNCDFDETFDDPCQAPGGDNCNGSPNDPFAGSGNGTGSNGPAFDATLGYPQGYDMPDCFLGGFAVTTLPIAQGSTSQATGFMIQRPGLLLQETYDPNGVTPDDNRHGTWQSPNVLGSSTWSRGSAVTETIYELGDGNGFYELLYAAYDSVSIDVYHHGVRVATTCGQVPAKTRGVLTFGVNLALVEGDKRVLVRVRGSNYCEWAYQLVGPKELNDHYDFDPHNANDYAVIGQNLYDEPEFVSLEYLGTPIFPAPCRATVGNTNIDRSYPFRLSNRIDNKNFFEYYHYAGEIAGLMVLDYSSWNNKDKIEVYHRGIRIATNYDFKNSNGSITFEWLPQETDIHELVVRVYTETLDVGVELSSWYYSLYCVDVDPSGNPWHVPVGPREFPWDCDSGDDGTPTTNPTTRNRVFSMGHVTMEDNINIDNGVAKGAFKILFNNGETATTEAYITVFNEDGTVIKSYDANQNAFVNTVEVIGQNVEIDYFNFDQTTEATFKKIYVRVDSELGNNWDYTVGCPIPLIDITLDPVDVAANITIDDVAVLDSAGSGQTMARLDKPMSVEVTVDYYMENGTAIDQVDYCSSFGTITFPVGVVEVPIPFDLAPCGSPPTKPPVTNKDLLLKPFTSTWDDVQYQATSLMYIEGSQMRGMLMASGTLEGNAHISLSPRLNDFQLAVNLLRDDVTKGKTINKILMVSFHDIYYTFKTDSDGRNYGKGFDAVNTELFSSAAVTKTSLQKLQSEGNATKAYMETFDLIYFLDGTLVFREAYSVAPTDAAITALKDTFESGIPFVLFRPFTGVEYPNMDLRTKTMILNEWGIDQFGYNHANKTVAEHKADTGDHDAWNGLSGLMLPPETNNIVLSSVWWSLDDKVLKDIQGRKGKWLNSTIK